MPPTRESTREPAREPSREPTRNTRPIQLAGLRGFEATARRLSFTLAARELHLTQSSLSRQVATLERQLGARLFIRHTRALELTAAGERLFAAATRALQAIDSSVAEIRGSDGPPRVSVGTYASFASLWLVPRLAAFQQAHPEVEVRIDAADRVVDLDAEGLDVAVRRVRVDLPLGADAVALLVEEVTPALNRRLLDRQDRKLDSPADLVSLPLIELEAGPRSLNWSWSGWLEYAGVAGDHPRARLRFSYFDQSVQAAIRGQGAAIVPTPFIDDLIALDDLFAPFATVRKPTGFRYVLVTNPRRAHLVQVQAFRAWILEEFERGSARAWRGVCVRPDPAARSRASASPARSTPRVRRTSS